MNLKKLCSSSLIAAACTLAPAVPAQAEISDGVVRLGVMNDMSGPYADVTGMGSVIAAEMAVQDYAAATGSKLKIDVVLADHRLKPDVGSNIARKWYDTDGVDVIRDVLASSVGFAVSEIMRAKGKAFIAVGSGTTELTGNQCSPNTVQMAWTSPPTTAS